MGRRRWLLVCAVTVCAVACAPLAPDGAARLDLFGPDVHGIGGPRGLAVTDDAVVVASWATPEARPSEVVRLRPDGAAAGAPIRRDVIAAPGSAPGLALGPVVVRADDEGGVWFTMPDDDVVGRLPADAGGAPLLLHAGSESTASGHAAIDVPYVTETSSSGSTWFTNRGNDSLGVLVPHEPGGRCHSADDCRLVTLPLPGLLDEPVAIVEGPDVLGSADPELWVTNWGASNRVVVVDPEIVERPRHRWRRHVAVAIDFDTTTPVLALDPAEPIEYSSGPRSLAFADRDGDGDDDEVWVAHHDADALVRLDVESCGRLPCEISAVVPGAEGPTALAVGGRRAGGSGTPLQALRLFFTNNRGPWVGAVDLGRPGGDAVVRHSFGHRCPEPAWAGGSALEVAADGAVWFTSYSCALVGRLRDPLISAG